MQFLFEDSIFDEALPFQNQADECFVPLVKPALIR
jgi:hypothetical protein